MGCGSSIEIENKDQEQHVPNHVAILSHLTPMTDEQKTQLILEQKQNLEQQELKRQQQAATDAQSLAISNEKLRNSRLEIAKVFAAYCVAIVKEKLKTQERFTLVRVAFDYVKPAHSLDFKYRMNLGPESAQFNFGSFDEVIKKDIAVLEAWKQMIRNAGILVYSPKGIIQYSVSPLFIFVLQESSFLKMRYNDYE